MRIFHIDTAHTWRGGEAQVLELTKRLRDRGHSILLAAQPASPLADRAKITGLDVREIRMRGEWDGLAVIRLAGLIRTFRPDIIHTHTSHAHTLGLLAAKLAGEGKVVVSRRVDFPVARNLFSAWKYGNGVTCFIAVSNGIRKVLIDNGVPAEKVVTVYSGIDMAKFSSTGPTDYLYNEFGIEKNGFVVGNVAALAPHKDQSTLLKAVPLVTEKLPETRFLIVGEGELEQSLKRESAELGIDDNVIFTGFRWDLGEILSIFDIFVLSSYLEGLCTSLLDAMLFSLPIVATDVGGIPEAVSDGENGLLVPSGEPAKLAEAIISLLTDEVRRKMMGQKGREMVKGFDIESTITETEKIYQRIL